MRSDDITIIIIVLEGLENEAEKTSSTSSTTSPANDKQPPAPQMRGQSFIAQDPSHPSASANRPVRARARARTHGANECTAMPIQRLTAPNACRGRAEAAASEEARKEARQRRFTLRLSVLPQVRRGMSVAKRNIIASTQDDEEDEEPFVVPLNLPRKKPEDERRCVRTRVVSYTAPRTPTAQIGALDRIFSVLASAPVACRRLHTG